MHEKQREIFRTAYGLEESDGTKVALTVGSGEKAAGFHGTGTHSSAAAKKSTSS
jgi:hypothetical protein